VRILFLSIFVTTSILAQINFDDFFLDKTLRLDYYHTGDKDNDSYSFDELKEEPYWGGSKVNLIDRFNYGKYLFKVIDTTNQELIYSRTYSTLFSEWQTTDEAKQTVKSFSETVVFPYPKKTVRVEFYGRDKRNEPAKKFEYVINPDNYFIKPERTGKYTNFEVVHSGDPSTKLDIVVIPEGYTENEMDKFKEDCKKFAGYFAGCSPYKENMDKFNIWGIVAPSEESGTDIPAQDIWKNTVVNTNFYTFNLDRYLMTADNKDLRDIASYAPYDQIYILVNTDKYGGGSIYNHYSVCAVDNRFANYVVVHEFGHGFSSLADEYYTSDVAYEDFYPTDIEPLDPNITTLVDFESKWKDLVEADTPIPTPGTPEYKDVVGVFEGGGYVEKNVYRPCQDCTMKSISYDNFCPVCKRAIQQMIDFYTK